MKTILLLRAGSIALALCFALPVFGAKPWTEVIEPGFMSGDTLVLPSPDLAKLQMEDAKAEGGPWRYGIQIPVAGLHIDADGLGRWHKGEDGLLHWHLDLMAPAARTLDFHFSRLKLPQGTSLTIRGEGVDNQRTILPEDLTGTEFWSPYIAGERATLILSVPPASRHLVELDLGSVTHGYRGLFESADPMQKSGSCNIDVACNAGNDWHDQMRSVGQYTFSVGGSSYVCTGTLMANTGITATPYFLTARHCVSTQSVANSMVVYWNYQGAHCRAAGSHASGTPLPIYIASHSQSGATLRASYGPSDFTLLQLSSNVPVAASPFWSGWSHSTTPPTSARGIHHPAGHEKRISVDNHALTATAYGGGPGNTHWRVGNWEQGVTEGGSSGSGLWDQNKRLVGQLHGGSSACGNNLPDYYGRFSRSWTGGGSNATRLRNWLDPANTGAITHNGYQYSSFYQNRNDYPINDHSTVVSPISISNRPGNAPSHLRVGVRISHTYIGDLKVDLIAPNGTVYVLHNRAGGSRQNLFRTYVVNTSSSSANGTWRLRVNDNANGDTGLIDAWNLQF